ncbi:DUF2231 domain-containing protein [Microbacterium sp. NM3R9]|uniref:DUF2231 domain-containing protein n=1 Tax=Microbacterium thalli TaxID=3027921 RepID=UPI002365B1F0|nr:DUF2231 domain-containing protein [Microbacterium thalli]MDD7928251.1 DUF2231 domain-containing protein [Microbacterium thalli]MDN8550141.1 DUF2231 domain-containing protein [Microbacterium thalli]
MDATAPLTKAKYPRSLIAGPYGHPFHAIAIILPIGAWVSASVFDVLFLTADDGSAFALGARILIAVGLLGAVVAAILGLIDWSSIPKGTAARATGSTHMVINFIAMAIYTGSLVLRLDTDVVPTLAMIASFIGLALLSVSGWLGGKLAHTYGVRVATETTQAEGLEPLP